ncbi:MAG TPA: C1 family peptidase [Pyrinomonadaceae bacterium]|nr:C1 family peptidase [Pyrinomonadaceae bacterium]
MSKVDLRTQFPPVRSQRGLLSCTALVICDALWSGLQRGGAGAETAGQFSPSALFLYYNARKRAGHENHNAAVRPTDALDALKEYGICSEECWPYVIENYRERPPGPAYDNALRFKNVGFETLRQDAGQLRASLDAQVPFFFCLRLFVSNQWDFDYGETRRTGRLKAIGDSERPVRNHALLAVGYDDATASFLARNSFGEEWGDCGYVSVPYDYLLHPQKAYGFSSCSLTFTH